MGFEGETRQLREMSMSDSKSSCLKPGSKRNTWEQSPNPGLWPSESLGHLHFLCSDKYRRPCNRRGQRQGETGGRGGDDNLMKHASEDIPRLFPVVIWLLQCARFCTKGFGWCKAGSEVDSDHREFYNLWERFPTLSLWHLGERWGPTVSDLEHSLEIVQLEALGRSRTHIQSPVIISAPPSFFFL